jgi:hypothetical protein
VRNSFRWKKSERKSDAITSVLKSWLEDIDVNNPTLYNRWFIIKRVMRLTNTYFIPKIILPRKF